MIKEDYFKRLNEREVEEYRKWSEAKASVSLAATTSLKLFELFLAGHSCEEIARVNAGKFPLGMIVDARIRYDWDQRKDDHIADVYGGVAPKLAHAQREAVSFLTDYLTAAHKLHGDKIKKFLQTGDISDLGEFEKEMRNIKLYKEVVEILMKLTGQDSKKADSKLVVSGEVKHVHDANTNKKQLTGGQASELLRLFEDIEKN